MSSSKINKECLINLSNDFLWRIKSTLVMKRNYPILDGNITKHMELYKFGIPHYENQLRLKIII